MSVNNTKASRFPGLGNGLAASHDLETGEVIIAISDPLLMLVENAALDRVCSHCLTEPRNGGVKQCTGCKAMEYCSVACQSAAWKSVHKMECRIFKKLPRVAPTAVRALIQLLIRNVISGDASDSRWNRLESHITELKRNDHEWDEIVMEAKAALEWTSSPPELLESAINVLCRLRTNAFRATLPDSTPIGLCFEPEVSLANHSCNPNAAIIFDGRHMTLRALDPIKTGEQIFISYIDTTQTRRERRDELKDRYFFTCQCDKCEQDDGPYQTLLKSQAPPDPKIDLFLSQKETRETAQARCSEEPLNMNFLMGMSDLLSLSEDTFPNKQLPLLKQALEDSEPMRQHKIFAQSPYPIILQDMYLHYLTTSSTYTKALSLMLFIYLNCDVYNYPQPHHPIRVTRLYAIAKLLKNIEGLKDIDVVSANHTLLLCVRRLGKKSHGAESRFMKEVEEEIEDVQDVQRTRGDVGMRLEEWSKKEAGEDTEAGEEYARKIFEGLRNLATEALDGH